MEIHQSLLPGFHHHSPDDWRVRVQDWEVRWNQLHVSSWSSLGRQNTCSIYHHLYSNWSSVRLVQSKGKFVKQNLNLKLIIQKSIQFHFSQKMEGSGKTRTLLQCVGAAITPSYEMVQDDANVRLTWAHWKQTWKFSCKNMLLWFWYFLQPPMYKLPHLPVLASKGKYQGLFTNHETTWYVNSPSLYDAVPSSLYIMYIYSLILRIV